MEAALTPLALFHQKIKLIHVCPWVSVEKHLPRRTTEDLGGEPCYKDSRRAPASPSTRRSSQGWPSPFLHPLEVMAGSKGWPACQAS